MERMRVNLDGLALPPRLAALVEGLLDPQEEDRMSADEALAALQQPEAGVTQRCGSWSGSRVMQGQPVRPPHPLSNPSTHCCVHAAAASWHSGGSAYKIHHHVQVSVGLS